MVGYGILAAATTAPVYAPPPGFDLFGFAVLIVALVVMSFVQIALALGIMYALSRWGKQYVEETTYGQFDFNNFQKPAFQEFLTQLAMVFIPPTVVIHLLEFILIGQSIKGHPVLFGLMLVVLETGCIAACFHYIMKLDVKRLAIFTAANGFLYMILLWLFLYDKLF